MISQISDSTDGGLQSLPNTNTPRVFSDQCKFEAHRTQLVSIRVASEWAALTTVKCHDIVTLGMKQRNSEV